MDSLTARVFQREGKTCGTFNLNRRFQVCYGFPVGANVLCSCERIMSIAAGE